MQPAVQAFSLSAQFARESAMLKLLEERKKWGDPKGYYFTPQSSTVIKSKMAATTIRTRTRFRPPKIRLHCRLLTMGRNHWLPQHVIQLNTIQLFVEKTICLGTQEGANKQLEVSLLCLSNFWQLALFFSGGEGVCGGVNLSLL